MAFAEQDTFLVREHVGMLKLHEQYDILSGNGDMLGSAVETTGSFIKFLKLLMDKRFLPFTITISDVSGAELFTISRGFTFMRSRVTVRSAAGEELGYFKQRLLTLGGRFDLFSSRGEKAAELKGDWKGWNFTFTDAEGREIGKVAKKWSGIAKELFTSADNYVVHLNRELLPRPEDILLLLAAALCVDMVYKEGQR